MADGQPGGQDLRGAAGQCGCLGGPALACDGHGQVEHGQAYLGVAGAEQGFQDG
jgi:hypothetical protein